ncbi:hypothetical protein VP01_251g6 [Puccinia sorghi]|uniref:Reverse transcriptase Ty1/copia-type domain-containing protein n=1 Tax=Puccinia sorghi TaxID=27349 RepID=A0A0L6V5M2_9BASI|nr:hypothetical protein VP01_251g6 [Puccinia sorghi]
MPGMDCTFKPHRKGVADDIGATSSNFSKEKYFLYNSSILLLYPKGSKGRLIGYNEELQSYHILAEDGRIIDTKSVQFLDFQPVQSPQIEEEDNKPFEIIQEESHPISNQQMFDKEVPINQEEERIQIKQEFDLNDETDLYGLKQAPANWFETLTSWLNDIIFCQSTSGPCLFIHADGHSFVFFHVDDLIVAGKVDVFEDLFLLCFPDSSAHVPDTLLSMDLEQTSDSLSLSQPKLIKKGLELLKMEDCKPVKTPLSPGSHWPPQLPSFSDETGSCACNFNSLEFQWPSRHQSLVAIESTNAVKYYTDATWADNLELRLSRTENNALSDGFQESQWITYLIEELWKEKLDPSEFNMKWLCELKNSNQINVRLIPSEEMVADALTKLNSAESLQRLQARCFLVLFSPN